MIDVQDIFNKTLEIVKECGEIVKHANKEKDTKIKEDGSFVTKYDLLVDEKLTKGLKQIVDCSIYSEEHKEEQKETYFIIDPIDGTHNFNSGFELYCIMVGFVRNDEVLFNIIYAPSLDKMFTAIKGKGAFLNDKKISMKTPEKHLLGFVNISTLENIDCTRKLMASELDIELRSIYCTGLTMCYIASGAFDFLCIPGEVKLWDIIPGKLILEEAGGTIKYKKREDGNYNIIAGNKEVVDMIEEVTQIV